MGCANPGPPQPPSLKLPTPIRDLAASRVGDAVLLNWTTPSDTTDNLPVPPDLSAELCRSIGSAAPTCLPRVPVTPGPGTLTDQLPLPLLASTAGLISYRARLFNGRGHSAAPSNEALAPPGPGLAPVSDLQLTPIERAVRITWQSSPPLASVELTRVDLTPKPARSQPNPAAPVRPAPTPKTAKTPEVHLRVAEQITPGSTLLGADDDAVAEGDRYRYTVQRFRELEIAGHRLQLRSLPSSPITVAIHDVFPPRAPLGLAAVPTSEPASPPAPNQAQTPGTLSIDLSWEPGAEPDIAGYLVYRANALPGGPNPYPAPRFTRITSDPVRAPAFRDTTVTPATRYLYRITAVDNSGNESAPGNAIEETAPRP